MATTTREQVPTRFAGWVDLANVGDQPVPPSGVRVWFDGSDAWAPIHFRTSPSGGVRRLADHGIMETLLNGKAAVDAANVTPATWRTALAAQQRPVVARRTTNSASVNNSTTLVNDDVLILALAANSVYWVQGYVSYLSSTVADFKFAWSIPSGMTGYYTPDIMATSGTTEGAIRRPSNLWSAAATAGGGSGGEIVALPQGVAVTTNAGNLTFQFAQNTAEATNTSIRTGSTLTAWPLA